MAMSMNRIAPVAVVAAFLAIASVTQSTGRERRATSPDTLRVRELQRRVNQATQRLEALTRRDSVLASLPKHAGESRTAPRLVIDSRLPATHRSVITRAAQRQWTSLRMNSARVPVVIAVIIDTAPSLTGFAAGRGEYAYDYVLPAATTPPNDQRCITIVTLHSRDLVRPERQRAMSELFATPSSASRLLGPCAFVARFGAAGPGIDPWLRSRGYDLAAYPRWVMLPSTPSDDAGERWRIANADAHLTDQEIWLSPEALGCVSGITHHCAATLLGASDIESAPSGGLIMMRRGRDPHWATLSAHYLSDLVTALGPENFGRFWRSTLAPDAALRAVAGRPLDVWTQEWAVGLVGEQRVGPAVSFAEVVGALTLAGLSLAIAAWGWGRRQVR